MWVSDYFTASGKATATVSTLASADVTAVNCTVAQPSVSSHEPITVSSVCSSRLGSPHAHPHTVSIPSSSIDTYANNTVATLDMSASVGDTNRTVDSVTDLHAAYKMNLATETITPTAVRLNSDVEMDTGSDASWKTPVEMSVVDKPDVSDNVFVGHTDSLTGDVSKSVSVADSIADMSCDSDSDTECQSGVNSTFTLTSSPVMSVSTNRHAPTDSLLTSMSGLHTLSDSPSSRPSGIHHSCICT